MDCTEGCKQLITQKLIQNQRLKPQPFEYEPIRGQIDYGRICGTLHSFIRENIKD